MSDDKLGPALPPRKKVTHFISAQLDNKTQATNQKAGRVHYGKCELRELLDFLYGGTPKDESEML